MKRRAVIAAGAAALPGAWLAGSWPAAAWARAAAPASPPEAHAPAPAQPPIPPLPAPPAAGPETAATLMAWAMQWQAQGRAATAIWLGKRALAAAPADAPLMPVWSQTLIGWLIEAARLDEARALGERERAAALARFVDDTRDPAAALPPVPFDADETAWTAAWPPGLPAAPDAPGALAAWQALPSRPQARQGLTAGAPRATPAPARSTAPLLRVHALPLAERLLLLLDDGRNVTPWWLHWPQAQREQELGAVLSALAEPTPAAAPTPLLAGLRSLHQRFGALIERAARRAGAREIELHAGGALRALPWAALLADAGYLGERLAVRVAPLAPARRAAGAARPTTGPATARATATLRALGVSRASAGLPALPGVVDEVCGIVAGPVHGLAVAARDCGPGVVGGEGWLDEAFTAERLVEAVTRPAGGAPGLLHLGTHFDLRPGRMARSSLLLGDGSRWPLARIAALDFSALQLVTLAACDTGSRGGSGSASEAFTDSLQDLILQRGAGHVLASLWRVDDASTSALMRAFYGHWGSAAPAVALQRAQAAVRERPEWRAPFHWAGFVLAGEA